MNLDISRRGLIGLAASNALVGTSTARAALVIPAARARFGPPAGEAHLIYNENPYGPAPSAIRAMAEAAGQGSYYIDDIAPKLAEMIARRHRVSPDQVVLGNGSSEVLAAAALAWGGKGAILTSELTFDEALRYAEPKGVKLVRQPMASDMGIDLPGLAARAGPDITLLHICNPNNPTGMLIDAASLRGFVRSMRPGTTVLVDEAYNELTDQPEADSVVDLVREGRDVIVTRTFSKIYGMAGLRVGYAISTPANAQRIRDWNMTIGLNSAGLAAALASYNDTGFLAYSRARITQGRAMIVAAVKAAGLRSLPSQANFVFVEVPDADRLQKAMATRGIMIRGSYGRWHNWSRVSTGKLEHIRRYADALPQLVRS